MHSLIMDLMNRVVFSRSIDLIQWTAAAAAAAAAARCNYILLKSLPYS